MAHRALKALCMKRCIVLAFLLLGVGVVMAQAPPSSADQSKLTEPSKSSLRLLPGMQTPVTRLQPLQDTGKAKHFRKLTETQRLQRGGLITATYSHTTSRGKVYTLSPDNMPCLVPDTKTVAPMPNQGGVLPDDRMNRLPRQRIIPRDDQKDEDQQARKKE